MRTRFINQMLSLDRPTLRYVSPRTHIRKTDDLERPFHSLFALYEGGRAELLARLVAFSDEDWQRSADFKEKRSESVLNFVHYLNSHETAHLDQLERLCRAGG